MAVFPSFKLTKKGEELLNRSIGEGKILTFTKFEIGDGNPPVDFREQTSLVNKFYQFPVLSTDIQKNQVLRIKGYFDNKSFTGDKQLKEIGVFVKIQNDETEYLYSYTNAGESGDIIPGNTRGFYSRTLDVANYIGYATNITFNIEQLRDRYAFNTENEMKVASYLKAGDKVELWGNLVLGDKPTDEYIIQESGEIQLNNGLFAKKVSFKYIAQTIEEMKKLALKVGDVVEVLGYYTAGDGAGHKRIIKSDDDGSGVQISNGKWANIVHNGEVNVSWFGCENSSNQNNNLQKIIDYCKGLITIIIDKDLILSGKENECSVIINYDNQVIIGVNNATIKTDTKFANPLRIGKIKEHTLPEKTNIIKNVKIKNIIFEGVGGYEYYGMFKGRGLTIINSEHIEVSGCTFKNWTMLGLDLIMRSNGAKVINNKFIFNGGYQCVAFNQAGENSIFANNYIESEFDYLNGDKSGSSLIQVTGSVSITGNTFNIPKDKTGSCLVIGESQVDDCSTIVGNVFNGGYMSVAILSNNSVIIEGNVIKNSFYAFRATDIGSAVKTRRILFSNNSIINCNYGIFDVNTKSAVYNVLNNTFIKYEEGEITGTDIWNFGTFICGIKLNDADGHIIKNNYCKGCKNTYTLNINKEVIFKDNFGNVKISMETTNNWSEKINYDELDFVRKKRMYLYSNYLVPCVAGTTILSKNKVSKDLKIVELSEKLQIPGGYSYETGIDFSDYTREIFIQILLEDNTEILTNDFIGFENTKIKLKQSNAKKLMISKF